LLGSAFEFDGRTVRVGDHNEPSQSTEISNGQFADTLYYRSCFAGTGTRNHTKILIQCGTKKTSGGVIHDVS
jgi:hypothetical protein